MKDFLSRLSGYLLAFVFLTTPSLAFAIRFDELVSRSIDTLQGVAKLFLALAVFFLAYWILRYLNAGADPKRLAEAGRMIAWGLISIFIMLSFWGILRLLLNTFFSPRDRGSFQMSNSLFNP